MGDLIAVATLQRSFKYADRLMVEKPKETTEIAKNLAVALRDALESEEAARRLGHELGLSLPGAALTQQLAAIII